MKNNIKKIVVILSAIRLLPHILLFNFHKNKKVIHYDVERWLKITNSGSNLQFGFLTLMTFFPEYRNVFYNRVGKISFLINWLCPKMNTLFILTKNIGPGLFIQHGFATIISAKSIGRDCWINQQVTIGFSNATDSPELGDNVTINAGAKIIGKVKMGNNSKAGANAVVVKNVPENCTVIGVPAYIIRRDGVRVKEEL
jgi:serine O-acetyltransferase